jgi:hypothetical protein
MTQRSILMLVTIWIAATLLLTNGAVAQIGNEPALPISSADSLSDDITAVVEITGDFEETISENSVQIHLINGNAMITQGDLTVSAARMAVIATPVDSHFDVAVYAEDLTIRSADTQTSVASRAFRLQTSNVPSILVKHSTAATPMIIRFCEKLCGDFIRTMPEISQR